jgi:hypothetical protein
MDDLWTIASDDHEGIAREGALARADADLEGILPFLYAARSDQEFFHRLAVAGESFAAVEARHGLEEGTMTEVAARRYALYREALAEGTDPLTALIPLLNGGGDGSGPEKPDAHSEGPDFSGSYSEVPTGPLSGPNPMVTRPRPEAAAPVQEATGALRRTADASQPAMMTSQYTPPDLGTGSGSLDIGVASPGTGGMTPSIPAGMPGGSAAPAGQVTSSRDPVRSKVLQATAAIARANPGLPREECERVARKVVSGYLRQADLTDSVMGNGPMTGGGSGGDGSGGGGGHGGAAKDMLAGQGLRSMLPGGAGAGAGAGAAAGGAGELAELAPLLAL